MSCFHPNIIIEYQNSMIRKDNTLGSKVYFIRRGSKQYEDFIKQNKVIQNTNAWQYYKSHGKEYKFKMIPCGKCQGCRIKERQEWATRIELECKLYKNNYFITLTYDDENLPIPEAIVKESTGEIIKNPGTWTGTLVKNDARKFINSVRKWFEREYYHKGMKFYLCGEYGSADKTERPHYHAILMNCPELELKPIGQNRHVKLPYFTNDHMQNIWGKGFITIGKVNWDSITYVAGYCNKKLFGEYKEEYYTSRGKLPIFAMMSRNPGIGANYLNQNLEKIYKNDEIINSKGKSIKPPKYFDRKLKEYDEEMIKQIKKIREEKAENDLKLKMSQTTNTIEKQNEIDEEISNKKQTIYNRSRINESIY